MVGGIASSTAAVAGAMDGGVVGVQEKSGAEEGGNSSSAGGEDRF